MCYILCTYDFEGKNCRKNKHNLCGKPKSTSAWSGFFDLVLTVSTLTTYTSNESLGSPLAVLKSMAVGTPFIVSAFVQVGEEACVSLVKVTENRNLK